MITIKLEGELKLNIKLDGDSNINMVGAEEIFLDVYKIK